MSDGRSDCLYWLCWPAWWHEWEVSHAKHFRTSVQTIVILLLVRHHLCPPPWSVIAAWLVILSATLIVLPSFLQRLGGIPMSVSDSQSQQASTLLQHKFSQAFSEQDLIVYQSDTLTVLDPAFQRVIAQSIQNVAAQPGVVGVIGPLDPQVTDQVSADGHTAVALLGLHGLESTLQRIAPSLARQAQSAATPTPTQHKPVAVR